MKRGLKLHFGNSDVQLDEPDHVDRLRAVFARANALGMAIVVHAHGSFNKQRPHGARQMTIFLEQLLPAAPDVPVQIAHFTSAAGYDEADHAAMGVLAAAIQRSDPRSARLYFDASGITINKGLERGAAIVERMRQIGTDRVLFGSDGTTEFLRPVEAWAELRKLPLTAPELAQVAVNVAPYLRR